MVKSSQPVIGRSNAARRLLLLAPLLLITGGAAHSFQTATPVRAGGNKVRRHFDLKIPMRDGVKLSADVWAPAEEGRYPIILMRCPYLKTMELLKVPVLGEYFASR